MESLNHFILMITAGRKDNGTAGGLIECTARLHYTQIHLHRELVSRKIFTFMHKTSMMPTGVVGSASIDLTITRETGGILECFFRRLLHVPSKDI